MLSGILSNLLLKSDESVKLADTIFLAKNIHVLLNQDIQAIIISSLLLKKKLYFMHTNTKEI